MAPCCAPYAVLCRPVSCCCAPTPLARACTLTLTRTPCLHAGPLHPYVMSDTFVAPVAAVMSPPSPPPSPADGTPPDGAAAGGAWTVKKYCGPLSCCLSLLLGQAAACVIMCPCDSRPVYTDSAGCQYTETGEKILFDDCGYPAPAPCGFQCCACCSKPKGGPNAVV